MLQYLVIICPIFASSNFYTLRFCQRRLCNQRWVRVGCDQSHVLMRNKIVHIVYYYRLPRNYRDRWFWRISWPNKDRFYRINSCVTNKMWRESVALVCCRCRWNSMYSHNAYCRTKEGKTTPRHHQLAYYFIVFKQFVRFFIPPSSLISLEKLKGEENNFISWYERGEIKTNQNFPSDTSKNIHFER